MTAQDYIYRMLDTYSLDEGNPHVMINASNVQVEACMRAYAEEKVREAIRAISIKRLPAIGQDIVYLEQFVNFVLREDYPINENIK